MSVVPSIYNTATIESVDGRNADFRVGCASIDYYEDLFCPSVSVKINVANAGGAVTDESGTKTSLYEGLKIRGGEVVKLKIAANSPNNVPLDFTTKCLYVRGISNLIRDTQREFFTLSLVPKEAVQNEVSFLQKAYSKESRIEEHVRDIIREKFPESTVAKVDPTANKLGFIGNQMKPFEALVRLASKSATDISNSGSAGFFFYQTSEGLNFRSIDSLMGEPIKAKYFYTQVVDDPRYFKSTPELPSLDFKIINFTVLQNQDIVAKLKKGAYATDKRFFDPVNFTISKPQDTFEGKDYIQKAKNLGYAFDPVRLGLSDGSVSFTDTVSEILTEIKDFGTVDKEVSREPTKDIDEYMTQRKMRYNTLFTQVVYIQVPLNTNLHAGDLIECKFPKITDVSSYDDIDTDQISGIYMIKELNHHFDHTGSFTSMQILRDTYGLYKTNR